MPIAVGPLSELQAVNDELNALPYALPAELGEPPDFWADIRARGAGDCIQYAVGKKHRLIELGWSAVLLTYALCWTEPIDGVREYHGVLAAECGDAALRRTMILDNRFPQVYEWDRCPADYRWDRRQVPGRWDWEKIG